MRKREAQEFEEDKQAQRSRGEEKEEKATKKRETKHKARQELS